MNITKKWTILILLSVVTILALFLITNEKTATLTPQQELIVEHSPLPKSSAFIESEPEPEYSAPTTVENNFTKEEVPEESMEPLVFSQANKIMDIHEQRQKDPTITLKISDFSPKEQAAQIEWLTSYNEKGYVQTSDISFDYIKSQNELVELVEPDPATLLISLQDVSNTKLSEYEYLGQVLAQPERKNESNSPSSEITRAYRGNDGQDVFLLEKSVKNSQAILVEEFVTEKINGYPASRMTFCSETEQCMSKITLITKDKFYEVSTYGDQNSSKDTLIEIISSFNLPELKVQSM